MTMTGRTLRAGHATRMCVLLPNPSNIALRVSCPPFEQSLQQSLLFCKPPHP